MKPEFDKEQGFNKYFHALEGYSLRSERFYASLSQFNTQEALAASLVLWLESAYKVGAEDMKAFIGKQNESTRI